MDRYPVEILDEYEDNGTMPENVDRLRKNIVGHKIIRAEKFNVNYDSGLLIELDNGKKVKLIDDGDCCAYTALDDLMFNIKDIDHIITGVGTTDKYTKWHIYADLGDILTLFVDWSAGNPFYYGYGFDIVVEEWDGK